MKSVPEGPTVRRATRRSEMDALPAIVDLLEREPTTDRAFEALTRAIRPVVAFEVMALSADETRGPLLSCTADREDLRPTAMAVIDAAKRYFDGAGSFEEYVSLTNSPSMYWTSLPLTTDGTHVLGVITLGSEAALREETLAFLASVTRRFAQAVSDVKSGARLRKAVADPRAMLRERDQMLSTVSHDLQNPLGVILMSAAHLLEGMPPNDRRRAGRAQVEAIHRNARRMKRLVTDLLDFDAIEAGRMAMTPRAVHPRTLVNAAIEDMSIAADASGITLRRGALARLPSVWADMERVVQVLLNLISNSLKFTPRGGRITLRARRSSETEVTFAVQDTGAGISPDELPFIFDRHWQSPSSGAVRKKGSGLGLAICKSLIELSRGRIWAESRQGKGTTIMFTLPIAADDGAPE